MKYNLPDIKWVMHHLMMIAKKLTSEDRGNMTFLADELFLRYIREYILDQKSALKYIFGEKKAESMGIVLRIDKIQMDDGKESAKQGVSTGKIHLELTDGWYNVQMSLNKPKAK